MYLTLTADYYFEVLQRKKLQSDIALCPDLKNNNYLCTYILRIDYGNDYSKL